MVLLTVYAARWDSRVPFSPVPSQNAVTLRTTVLSPFVSRLQNSPFMERMVLIVERLIIP